MDSILNPLYIAVSWVIVSIHKLLTPVFGTDSGVSWSLAIIGLVIIIRIILIPLFVKQIKSQRALTALQPHMKEIQKKYKDDRQKQSEEMMKLYKPSCIMFSNIGASTNLLCTLHGSQRNRKGANRC
jgi:YidC/Oxa1 family membrane protein insertase